MRTELEALIRSRGLNGSVFLLGQCHGILALLRRCDIGLLVCRSEAQPNCLVGFVAAGLPYVTWAYPTIAELAGNGEGRIVVGDDSAGSIPAGLIRLAKSAQLPRRMGWADRQRIEGNELQIEGHMRRIDDSLVSIAWGDGSWPLASRR